MNIYRKTFAVILCIISFMVNINKAQDIAEDFTLTDIDTVSHTLYDYLDGDLKVVLVFYAVWDDLSQDNMAGVDSVWAAYGPDGDSTVVILGMEIDDYTTDSVVAEFDTAYNCWFPQINQTGDLADIYNITYIPRFFVICPDRSYTDFIAAPATVEEKLIEAIEGCSVNNYSLDVKAINIDGINISICDTVLAPEIRIQNIGTTDITSLDIISKINSVDVDTFAWTGSLARYDIENVVLPEIYPITDGQNTYTCVLTNPNSGTDEDTGNNTIERSFTVYSSAENVALEIIPDDYPEEINWYITDSNNDTLFSGEGYEETDMITEYLCLHYDSCYNFIINDSYSDGFTEGGGSVAMHWNDELILFFTQAEHDDSSYTAVFCVNEYSVDEILKNNIVNVYPNPTAGKLNIEYTPESDTSIRIAVTNMLGKIIFIQDYPTSGFRSACIDLGSYPAGLYNVSVITSQEIISKKIILSK